MMRTLIMSTCLLLTGLTFAQNEQQQINAIKSNMNFLYATGTSSVSEEEASANAKDLLTLEVEQWLRSNAEGDIAGYVAKSKGNVSQIQTKRGKIFRSFVFVKKKDILPYYKEEEIMVVDFMEPQVKSNDSIVQEKHKSADDPIVIVVENNEQTNVSQTKETDRPNDNITLVTKEVPSYTPTAKEREMLDIKTFADINTYIKREKQNGSILAAGKYSTLPKVGTIYTFIYNREGELPACIKMQDGIGVNLRTGRPDDVSAYKGCGAIWIQMK